MKTENQKYNGWTNYETWCCNLWFDQYLLGLSEEYTLEPGEYDNTGRYDFAKYLQESIESYLKKTEQLPETGLIADLIDASLSKIDWLSIAEKYMEHTKTTTIEELQTAFADRFYHLWGLAGLGEPDTDADCPWGCPWTHGSDGPGYYDIQDPDGFFEKYVDHLKDLKAEHDAIALELEEEVDA